MPLLFLCSYLIGTGYLSLDSKHQAGNQNFIKSKTTDRKGSPHLTKIN